MNNDKENRNDNKAKRIIKIISKFLTYAVLLLFVYIISAIVIGFVKHTPPRILGHYVFTVMSPSMEPEINVDDIVFVKTVPIEKVKVGDTISFICTDTSLEVYGFTIVHEALEIIDDDGTIKITTKGIANPVADNAKVTKDNFIGVVDGKSSLFGKIYKTLTSVYAIIYVFGLIIILKISQDAIKKIKEVRKEKEELELKEKIKQEYIESIKHEKELKENEEK